MTHRQAAPMARETRSLACCPLKPSETNPLRQESTILMNGLPAGAIVHGKCQQWWTGSRTAHCGGCHLTLSSTTAFDRHQAGHEDGCSNPASVGLVAVSKKWGDCWSWPANGRNPFVTDSTAGEP